MAPSMAASSIACAAPCARNGSIGWAASPSSATRAYGPLRQRIEIDERPFAPVGRRRRSACGRLACQEEKRALISPAVAPLRPEIRAPVDRDLIVDDSDDIDDAAAAQRIMDEMRPGAEPERAFRPPQFGAAHRSASISAAPGDIACLRGRAAAGAAARAERWPCVARTKERRPSAPIRQSPR